MIHTKQYEDHAAYLEDQAIKTADPKVIARFAAEFPNFEIANRVDASGRVWLLLHRSGADE